MDDDEDLAEVDRMERFESKFNFRFEEEEAARQAVKAKSAATFFSIQPQTAQQPGISVRTPYEALAIKRHDCIRSINEPFCLILVCCVRIVNLSLSSTASLGAPSRVRLCFVAVVSLSLSFVLNSLKLREGHDHASGDASVPPSMRGLLGPDGTVSFGKAQVNLTNPSLEAERLLGPGASL
jgi:hypothetical protein